MDAEPEISISLDVERAKRFFQKLADEPFVCVVVAEGEIQIYSKGMDDNAMTRIRNLLHEISQEI